MTSEKKSASKPVIITDVKPGPASPAQKQAWKRFWQKLITEVKSGEQKNPQPQ